MKTTNWKNWAKAALIRAVRTFAEAALAYIGTGAVVLGDVNWLAALSAGGFGFVTAILLALTGLPVADDSLVLRSFEKEQAPRWGVATVENAGGKSEYGLRKSLRAG